MSDTQKWRALQRWLRKQKAETKALSVEAKEPHAFLVGFVQSISNTQAEMSRLSRQRRRTTR